MVFLQEIIYLKKDGGDVINLDEYKLIEAHWIDFYVNGNNIIYSNIFGIKYIPKNKKIKKKTYKDKHL